MLGGTVSALVLIHFIRSGRTNWSLGVSLAQLHPTSINTRARSHLRDPCTNARATTDAGGQAQACTRRYSRRYTPPLYAAAIRRRYTPPPPPPLPPARSERSGRRHCWLSTCRRAWHASHRLPPGKPATFRSREANDALRLYVLQAVHRDRARAKGFQDMAGFDLTAPQTADEALALAWAMHPHLPQ